MTIRLPAGTPICRHQIPVDSGWHRVRLSGPTLAVATRRPDIVEFWASRTDEPAVERVFKVIGAGDQLPEDVEYVATAIGPTVAWHLVQRPRGADLGDRQDEGR